MRLISQGRFIRVSFAGLEAGGPRVVLPDVVVPVDHPDVAVRPDFGHDWSGPLVAAGQKIPGVARAEVTAGFVENKAGDQMSGRLRHEGDAVPVFLRISAGGVERMPG